MDLSALNLLSYQALAVANPARFTWNCWARQTGKSFTFALRRLMRGILRRKTQIILSAGQRQSREVMQKIQMHCRSLKIHSEFIDTGFYRDTSIRQLEVILPNGLRIIALPANPMTARGYTGDVFLDEFAMHRDDHAIWAALFPTLLRGQGELDVASTPRGRKNMFHRLRSNSMFSHTTLPLADAIGSGLQVDPNEVRAALGDEMAWRQEFCCEFADETTAFLTHDLIRSCLDPRLSVAVDWPTLEQRQSEIYAGVDIGRFRDLTAIWLWQRVGDDFITRGVITLAAAAFTEQEARLNQILDHVGVARCAIDAGGIGMHLAERLTQRYGDHRVEAVTFTAPLKAQLAGRLRLSAERGRLRIPADDDVIHDWHSVERIIGSGAHVRYDADRSSGGHADRFWAAALGLHAAENAPGKPEYMIAGPSAFASDNAW